jgi:glycosyltransferase involved in cell wall biosynthesis
MDGSPPRPKVAVVLKGYPRLSETFIAQEIHALEQRGLALALYSLRHPTDRATHPIHAAIRAPVTYLPEYLYREPIRVLRAWRRVRRLAGYAEARRVWLRDLRRDPTPNRIRRFGQALVLADELPHDFRHLHAHFLHTPASVTRYAALIRGLTWTCSAHAKDIWTTPDWEKREKLRDCEWITTCTAANAEHLRGIGGAGARVELIYHGLDTERFPPSPGAGTQRDGHDAKAPIRILAVGRAVDKKGFDDLLHALAALPAGLHWRFVHIGGGPLVSSLKRLAHKLSIDSSVRWLGPQAHDAVLAAYRDADLFALPCRIGRDGDRDGLPNVLLEAQSQNVACISTMVSGIPELITNGVTGLLVEPQDIRALARAIQALASDPVRRQAIARAGRERTTRDFSLSVGADRLAARLLSTVTS